MARTRGAHTRIASDDKHGSFGLRRLIALITGLAFFAALMAAAPANATDDTTTTGDPVCQGLDSGKIDVTGNQKTVTVTAPDGKLIDGYCVKAGSENSGDGPHYEVVDPPVKTLTFSYPSGKDISHYSVSYTDAPSCTTHPNTPGCVTPPDACPDMPGTQPPGTTCTTPPPPNCTTSPTMPGCPTPVPPVTPVPPMPPYDCPSGTFWVDSDHDGVEEQGECKPKKKVRVAVKKADKCGPNNSYYVKPVKGAHVRLFGKKVREGVWLDTKRSRLVLKAKVDNSKKFELVGKDRFVLVFGNDAPCHDTPDVTPPAGG